VEKAAVDWTASGHHLQMDAFAGQFGRPAYGFFCQPDGTFEILDVIPGEYRLIFHLEGKTEEVDRIGNRHRARLGTLVKTVTVNGTETDLGVFNMPPKRASGPMQSVPLF
jgi:hypothetical protein